MTEEILQKKRPLLRGLQMNFLDGLMPKCGLLFRQLSKSTLYDITVKVMPIDRQNFLNNVFLLNRFC
jgi:hypothetical protein